MNKTDVPAFIAMALYCCGFLASYGLMQSRPEPFTGITAAGLAHLVSVIVVSLMLPVFHAGGKKGRIFLALCLILGVAVRVPGVDGWLNEWLVRATVQVGQGTVAATSFWLFFTLTPREKRVDRFVMAWLAGMAGKEIIVLIGGQAPSVLYGCVGLVLVLNVAAAVVSVVQSGLPVNNGEVKQYRVAWRPLAILTVNTVVIAVVLGLLSGWIGSFHVEWAAANRLAPHLVMPALLVLVGVSLRGDFSTGFVRMARLCAVLCLALAGMAVLEREAAPVASIPYLAVGCQTVFYACTTLAMVRMAETTRYVGLAAVLPYAALIVSGLVAYDRTPLGDDHFSLMIFLSLAAFFTFFVSVKATGVAMPPERRMDLDLAGFFKYHGLSTREQEVSILLAGGLTNSDIAGQLYLSRHTINSHVRNVCEKAGVRNRAELVEVLRECADETREPGVHTPCPMRKTV